MLIEAVVAGLLQPRGSHDDPQLELSRNGSFLDSSTLKGQKKKYIPNIKFLTEMKNSKERYLSCRKEWVMLMLCILILRELLEDWPFGGMRRWI